MTKNLNFVLLCLSLLCSGLNAGTLYRELVLQGPNDEYPVEIEHGPIHIESISDDVDIPVAFKTLDPIPVIQEQVPIVSEIVPEKVVVPELKQAELVVVDVVENVKSIDPEIVAIDEIVVPVQSESKAEQLVSVDAERSPSVKSVVAEIIENDSPEQIIAIESIRQAQVPNDAAAVVPAPAPAAAPAPAPATPAQSTGFVGVIQNLIQNNPITQALNLNRPQGTAQNEATVPAEPPRPSLGEQFQNGINSIQQTLVNTFGGGQNNNPSNQASAPRPPSLFQNIQTTFSNIIGGGQQSPAPAVANDAPASATPAQQGPIQSFVSTLSNLVNNRIGVTTAAPAVAQVVPVVQAAPVAPVVQTPEVKESDNSVVPEKSNVVLSDVPVAVVVE
jgi:hypothetical protein